MSGPPRRGAQDQLGKDATTKNAALRGASLAFGDGKPPVKPKPQMNTYAGNNGALAAASRAGVGLKKTTVNDTPRPTVGEDQRPSVHRSGRSTRSIQIPEKPNPRSTLGPFDGADFGHLRRPGIEAHGRTVSGASLMAAQLAASRSPSVSPNPTGIQQLSPANVARLAAGLAKNAPSPASSIRSASSSRPSSPLDMTPIPPTTSLIDMFEKTGASTNNRSATRKTTNSSRNSGSSPQKSPAPRRIRPSSPSHQNTRDIGSVPLKPKPAPNPPPIRPTVAAKPSPALQKPSAATSKPISIPKTSKSSPRPRSDDDVSSDDSFVSAPDSQPSHYQHSLRAALQNQKTITRRRSTASLTSIRTIDSLANAIVASSLASSRAASPSKTSFYPPPPPPARRNGRNHHLFHNSSSRTPSPAKPTGLRATLRKSKSKDEIDEIDEMEKRRTKKAHIMKKHPNKHHEGDRKRWRDEVTERERKRYEAVWASNRGLHLSSVPGAENLVSNLVVRDIWSRSRLHNDVLEEVYALVDRTETGMLDKESFVCGLWLIDQWLKGRKLPPRVSDSVWRSLGMRGLKVRSAK